MLEPAKNMKPFVPLLIAIAAVAIVFLLIIQSSETFHSCIEHYQYKAAQNPPHQEPSSVPIPFIARQGCWGFYVRENAEAVVALFTIILAGITGGLWWSTRELWKATRDNFRATERAFIFVTPQGVTPFLQSPIVSAHISYRNNGRTIAKNIRTWGDILVSDQDVLPYGKMTLPKKTKGTDSLIPGAELTLAITKTDLPPSEKAEIKEGTKYLYLYGAIFYADEWGGTHSTRFCHRYDSNGLRPEGDIWMSLGYRRNEYGNEAD